MRTAIAVSLLALALNAVAADGRSIGVSATVGAYLTNRIDYLPAQIEFTDADIAAGYKDVGGIALTVGTNDPAGYVVMFKVSSAEVERVEISCGSRETVAGAAGTFVPMPLERPGRRVLPIRLRIIPTSGVTAGAHPFPVAITVYRRGS